jgi:hypothetical protein
MEKRLSVLGRQASSTWSCEGWLYKRGKIIKSWKKRWFCIKNSVLIYYLDQSKSKEKGHFDLQTIDKVELFAEGNRQFLFKLISEDKELLLNASSAQDRLTWTTAIEAYVQEYDVEEFEVDAVVYTPSSDQKLFDLSTPEDSKVLRPTSRKKHGIVTLIEGEFVKK